MIRTEFCGSDLKLVVISQPQNHVDSHPPGSIFVKEFYKNTVKYHMENLLENIIRNSTEFVECLRAYGSTIFEGQLENQVLKKHPNSTFKIEEYPSNKESIDDSKLTSKKTQLAIDYENETSKFQCDFDGLKKLPVEQDVQLKLTEQELKHGLKSEIYSVRKFFIDNCIDSLRHIIKVCIQSNEEYDRNPDPEIESSDECNEDGSHDEHENLTCKDFTQHRKSLDRDLKLIREVYYTEINGLVKKLADYYKNKDREELREMKSIVENLLKGEEDPCYGFAANTDENLATSVNIKLKKASENCLESIKYVSKLVDDLMQSTSTASSAYQCKEARKQQLEELYNITNVENSSRDLSQQSPKPVVEYLVSQEQEVTVNEENFKQASFEDHPDVTCKNTQIQIRILQSYGTEVQCKPNSGKFEQPCEKKRNCTIKNLVYNQDSTHIRSNHANFVNFFDGNSPDSVLNLQNRWRIPITKKSTSQEEILNKNHYEMLLRELPPVQADRDSFVPPFPIKNVKYFNDDYWTEQQQNDFKLVNEITRAVGNPEQYILKKRLSPQQWSHYLGYCHRNKYCCWEIMCLLRNKRFPTRKHYLAHMKKYHPDGGKIFVCNYCYRSFSSKKDCLRHRNWMHRKS